MLVADAVQAQVDADAAILGHSAHMRSTMLHNAVGQHAVGGDGDHLWPAVLVGADHHLVQVLAQERLAAGESHVERAFAPGWRRPCPTLPDVRSSLGLRQMSQVRHLLLQR